MNLPIIPCMTPTHSHPASPPAPSVKPPTHPSSSICPPVPSLMSSHHPQDQPYHPSSTSSPLQDSSNITPSLFITPQHPHHHPSVPRPPITSISPPAPSITPPSSISHHHPSLLPSLLPPSTVPITLITLITLCHPLAPPSPICPSSPLFNPPHAPSPGYGGCQGCPFLQDCAPGYTRTGGGLYLGHCELCECNGHSESCHPESGACSVRPHIPNGLEGGLWCYPSRDTPNLCPHCPPGMLAQHGRGLL